MIPKHYKLLHEHPHSYEIHDGRDGRTFHVAKQGLDLGMHAKLAGIQKFDQGGEVKETLGEAIGFPGSKKKKDGATQPPKYFAEGGEAGQTLGEIIGFPGSGNPKPKPPKTQHFFDGGDAMSSPTGTVENPLGMDVAMLDRQMGPASMPPASAPSQSPYGVAPQGPMPDPAAAPPAAPSSQIPGDGGAQGPTGPVAGPPDDPIKKMLENPNVNPVELQAKIMNRSLDEQESAAKRAIKQHEAGSEEMNSVWKNVNKEVSKLKKPEDIIQGMHKADESFQNWLQDPKNQASEKNFWASKNTGQKISAAIGIALGGFAAGMTGGHNQALEVVNKTIDRDIDAQKNAQGNKMNLWKMNREATKSDLEANILTRNQMLNMAEVQIKGIAAKMGGADAMLKLTPMLMSIQQQRLEGNTRLGLLGPSGDASDMDPSRLVPMLVKNPEQQKEVYGEIKRAQNISVNRQKIMDAFDRAAKDMTVMKTMGGTLEPASMKELHQLMLPNFKNVDGTVRESALTETHHNIDPQAWKGADDLAVKRRALLNWMDSETKAPTAMGNGIDLSKFKSTRPEQQMPVQEIRTMNGHPYRKVPGGWVPAGG